MASKDFSVADGETTTVYLSGYPRYDALRVDFDSDNSDSTDVDVEVKLDPESELDVLENDIGYAGMDHTVLDTDAIDPSSGDPSTGTTAMARGVAVQIIEQDTADGGESAEGTIYLHSSSDSAQNAEAFIEN